MSYSRFSNCAFYTFWDAYSGDTRDTQRLAVYVHGTENRYPCYPEAKEIGTVEEAQAMWPDTKADGSPGRPEASREDWERLVEIIAIFCEEVEAEYPEEA